MARGVMTMMASEVFPGKQAGKRQPATNEGPDLSRPS